MAIYRQYNIQLLPLDTKKTNEVGIDGYKEFFDYFKTYTTNSYKKKMMAKEAKPLINDTFICPFVVHIDDKFAYGKFVKYHEAETVTDFYSQERLFEAQKGDTAVSNTHYFNFIFDYEWHRFAIEENGSKLPSPDVMMQTLKHFLAKLAEKHFPNHTLTINLISDQRSLKEALAEGNEFGAIDVNISFPNSHRLTEELRELKDLSAHSIRAHVSPARGARMTGMPGYIRKLIENAPEFGDATITFFKSMSGEAIKKFKKMIYSTSEHPRKFALRKKKTEDEFGFVKRSWMRMNVKARVENENK